MKKIYWVLWLASAIWYAIPFLCNDYLWGLVFVFPVPFFYVASLTNVSFIQGYIWGCITFALHLSGGMYLMVSMAHEWWLIGIMLSIGLVLYLALLPALLFCGAGYGLRFFAITQPIARLLVWVVIIWLFIIWVDWYSMWIFGIQEGYPLMHPLLLLVKQPQLLWLLPIIGKQLLTVIFLLAPMSIVVLLLYRNCSSALFFCCIGGVWLACLFKQTLYSEFPLWHKRIKSLPQMVCSENPLITLKIIRNSLKEIIEEHEYVDIIILPESACTIDNFVELAELLRLWDENNVGKPIHIIFGASRSDECYYYNSLHWVYNGALQDCYDKRHAMILSERLPWWINSTYFQTIYFTQSKQVAASCTARKHIQINDIFFVPYICSELFFNENADDAYPHTLIVVIVNDSLFVSSPYTFYIQQLLLLLARFKAIQWQREIVYVSYRYSVLIDKRGNIQEI